MNREVLIDGIVQTIEADIDITELKSKGHRVFAHPPSLETLVEWDSEGYCEATDGCIVEPDGKCSHGCKSWLVEMYLI